MVSSVGIRIAVIIHDFQSVFRDLQYGFIPSIKSRAVFQSQTIVIYYYINVFRSVGGFEIAMMVGAMLKAAELSMLVLVDGFIASSAALVASEMHDDFLQYTQFCHQSEEQAHQLLLTEMGATPLLHLGMRLGEGSGVAVAYPLLVSGLTFLNEMASFADAGVSDSE